MTRYTYEAIEYKVLIRFISIKQNLKCFSRKSQAFNKNLYTHVYGYVTIKWST